jgi:hypothetical protein
MLLSAEPLHNGGVAPEDARKMRFSALCKACAGGHLAVAQWLVDHCFFGAAKKDELTPEDARAKDTDALRGACAYGHLTVAQWLTERFGLTTEDARARGNDAIRAASINGHLDVAQWLIDKFGLTAADAGEYADMLDFSGVGLGPKSAAKIA